MAGLRHNLHLFNNLTDENKKFIIVNQVRINKMRDVLGTAKCVQIKDLDVTNIIDMWLTTKD